MMGVGMDPGMGELKEQDRSRVCDGMRNPMCGMAGPKPMGCYTGNSGTSLPSRYTRAHLLKPYLDCWEYWDASIRQMQLHWLNQRPSQPRIHDMLFPL